MKTRQPLSLTILVCATLVSSYPAFAQFSQQGPKLVGTGAEESAEQGNSVSLSADGNTAIVGAPEDHFEDGAVWIWTRSGGVWTQQGSKLVGSGAVGGIRARQGYSVALSADGNTAIVGGWRDNGFKGAAWVWTRNGGVWTQQGQKLVASEIFTQTYQGASVSLSNDGNTALVGGRREASGNTECAWVWTRKEGVWTQEGSALVGSGAVLGTNDQGAIVALSSDGNTAMVGAYNDNNNTGAAWVWTRVAGIWTQQGSKLVGSGAVGNARQGVSVTLSEDGNTAIIGGNRDNSSAGAIWVWTRVGGVWTQQGSKLVGSGAVGPANQGNSVSLAANGSIAIAGGFSDNSNVGAAWVWTRVGEAWTQLGPKLVGSGAVGTSEQYAVSLSANGSTAIVGGFADNNQAGAAWVFTVSADVGMTKSVNGGPPFAVGANVSYTITVANAGPGGASSVVMTDVLPAGTAFVSAAPSQGSCSGTTTVTCALGALANGASATINLVVKSSVTPGVISNTATVAAAETDPNPANNSSTSTITTIDSSLIPATSEWVLLALAGMLAMVGALKIRS